MQQCNFCFLGFLQFWHSILSWFKGHSRFLWTQMDYFFGRLNFQKLLLGVLIKLKTFIFCASFNFNFCFWVKSLSFWAFWGPNGLVLGVRVRFKTVLGSTHVVEQLLFSLLSPIVNFDFHLILGSLFYFLGPLRANLGSG